MANIHCISYVSGPYEKKKPEIERQMIETRWFKTYKVYTKTDLSEEFKIKNSNILNQSRGGGYWIWKPFIISDYLNHIPENDYLIYMDGGCSINSNNEATKHLMGYLKTLEESKKSILRFYVNPFTESEFTNSETIKYFGENYGLDVNKIHPVQIMATIIIMKKNQYSVDFFEQVLQILQNKPQLFTDEYNKTNPNPKFVDHRHDQSIMSLLTKVTDISHIIDDDTWNSDFSKITHIPITATRKSS